MDSLKELTLKRRQFLNALKDNRFQFKDLLVGNYENPAHFIYELIQNADDAGAMNIHFDLADREFKVSHDGRPFDLKDVQAITSIGISTKTKELNQIGKFGVGFKSVYAISRTPRIFSGSFHFEIKDFVMPIPLDSADADMPETTFTFPFDHEFRSTTEIHRLILHHLRSLTPHVLLFLNHISGLSWQSGTDSERWRVESGAAVSGATIKTIHNSRQKFQYYVQKDTLEHSLPEPAGFSLAFHLKKDKICADPDATWSVYLPTEKKNPLMFSLHGDYRTTPNREQVPLSEHINAELLNASARLFGDTLKTLADTGYYDPLKLADLPLDKSKADHDSVYRLFYQACIKALKKDALLPDQKNTLHLPHALIACQDREFINLFDVPRLSLINKKGWLHDSLNLPHNIRSALVDIGLDWQKPEEILAKIDQPFIQKQPDQWIIKLYRYLFKRPELWHKSSRTAMPLFRYLPILRLEDGRHVHLNQVENGVKCFLPPPKRSTNLPIIKRSLCKDSKSRAFLRRLALDEPDTMAELNVLLKRYGEPQKIQWKQYAKDLQQLMDLYYSVSAQQQSALIRRISEFALVAAKHPHEGVRLQYPNTVYWPTDRLKTYFQNENRWFVSAKLGERFSKDSLIPFLHALGIRRLPKRIPVESDLTDSQKRDLRNGKWVIDRELYLHDYQLDGLESFLDSFTPAKSLLLWDLLLEMASRHEGDFFGEYAWLDIHKKSAAFPAAFIRQLRKIPWLMDKDDHFHAPPDINPDRLSPEYQQPEPAWLQLADLLEMATPILLSARDRKKLALVQDFSLDELESILNSVKK